MDLEPTAISRRIAQARKQAGYSQHRFANELGVHWRSVQNWERPDASVPWDRLPEIARLTEVKVEWLLGAQQTADVTGMSMPDCAAAISSTGAVCAPSATVRRSLSRAVALRP